MREAPLMFTIEFLMVDWDDRDHPAVVGRIPTEAKRLGDVNMVAQAILADTVLAPPNAFRIKDDGGFIVLKSWERSI
jgi:hypothetical protein